VYKHIKHKPPVCLLPLILYEANEIVEVQYVTDIVLIVHLLVEIGFRRVFMFVYGGYLVAVAG
jgi:hypothetical protein